MACSEDHLLNVATAETLVREAASKGAKLILLQELFQTPYFCAEQNADYLDLANTFADNSLLNTFSALAKELDVVLPISFFERTERQFFNSIAIIDGDGTIKGIYRKTHIPDGPGYQEKFYFTPGNSGFKVWDTCVGKIGVGICWDQWFPECARSMALMGADVLLYPTAIGNEPQAPDVNSKTHWQRTMQGHAAANMCVLAASNRIGTENVGDKLTFYGGSFICDHTGEIKTEMDDGQGVSLSTFDLAQVRRDRQSWGVFRDRRPSMYDIVSSEY